MFGIFKKKKNLHADLEKIENELNEMSVNELMNIMMKISNIKSLDLKDLKKHTFILIVLTLEKMNYEILDIEKNRDFTIAIDDCAWRIRDNIMDRIINT